jgi:WD40 repeat protein
MKPGAIWRLMILVPVLLGVGLLVMLGIAKLWTRSFPPPTLRMTLDQEKPSFVTFHPDGTTLASGSADGQIKFWDSGTGDKIATLEGSKGEAACAAFSPDGKLLASGVRIKVGGTAIRIWDVGTQKLQATFPGEGVGAVAFHPEGRVLAAGCLDGTIRLWDVATAENTETIDAGSGIEALAFSPDGKKLASAGTDDGEAVVKLWDLASGQIKPSSVWEVGPFGAAYSVAFSPDGRMLAGGAATWQSGINGGQGGAILYDLTARKKEQFLSAPTCSVYCVAFSPDGTILAGGCFYGAVLFWDAHTGKRLTGVQNAEAWEVQSVSFSPDGTTLAAGCFPGGIRLWDLPLLR